MIVDGVISYLAPFRIVPLISALGAVGGPPRRDDAYSVLHTD